MAALVDHSLVQQSTAANGETRFTMLDSLRTFAAEQLEASGEMALVNHRHMDYYLRWAEQILPWLEYPDQRAVDVLEAEHENCRTALTWSLTEGAEHASGLRMALVLYPYWHVGGFLSDGRRWMRTLIAHSADPESVLVARAQACAAELARLQGDYAEAARLAEESWSLAHALGDDAAMALALVPLGWAAYGWDSYNRLDYTTARQHFETSLELFRALGKPGHVARVLHDLAYLAMRERKYIDALAYYKEELALSSDSNHQHGIFWALHGMAWVADSLDDRPRARTLYAQCLAQARDLRHSDGIAVALTGLGGVACYEGKFAQAAAYYRESERVCRQLGRKAATARALQCQGYVALRQNGPAQAIVHYTESLGLLQDLENTGLVALSLAGLAAVACVMKEYESAVRLLGSVAPLLADSHQVLDELEQQLYDQSTTEARAGLDVKAFDQALAAGHALPLERAIAEAFAIAARVRAMLPENTLSPSPAGLTRREVEVLRLVAQGLTNAQIAATLVISPGTVNAHLTGLYRKLNTSSRAVATRFAVEHGLV